LKKIKENQLDLSGESVFLLYKITKEYNFDIKSKECELFEVLYMAIIKILLEVTGDKGQPFYIWSKLTYEFTLISNALNKLKEANN